MSAHGTCKLEFLHVKGRFLIVPMISFKKKEKVYGCSMLAPLLLRIAES